MSSHIGLIGIGLLGSAMAERLLAAGFTVFGHDADPARRAAFQSLGGVPSSDNVAVASGVERLLLSLPDSSIVATVVSEIEAALQPGSLVIDTTTGSPKSTLDVAKRLEQRGVVYVDATVLGSSQQARTGDIVVMAGGDAQKVDACEDIFAAIAKETFHVGPCGSGARMKLVVNLVLGLNRAVLAEGLVLAKGCGIEPDTALQVLRSGAAYCGDGQQRSEDDPRGFCPPGALSSAPEGCRVDPGTRPRFWRGSGPLAGARAAASKGG